MRSTESGVAALRATSRWSALLAGLFLAVSVALVLVWAIARPAEYWAHTADAERWLRDPETPTAEIRAYAFRAHRALIASAGATEASILAAATLAATAAAALLLTWRRTRAAAAADLTPPP